MSKPMKRTHALILNGKVTNLVVVDLNQTPGTSFLLAPGHVDQVVELGLHPSVGWSYDGKEFSPPDDFVDEPGFVRRTAGEVHGFDAGASETDK